MFLKLRFRRFAGFALLALFANSASASESMRPEVMFRVCGLPVTNAMLTTAVACLAIGLILRFVLLRGGAPCSRPSPGKGIRQPGLWGAGGKSSRF